MTQNNTETTSPTEGLSYEDALSELEQIVATLESGQTPLGQSLQLVQRGRELSELCATMLDEAELTLARLTATPEGELVEEELDWEDEDEEEE
jgi:exodeoxyribonuclease VII small subunit